MKYKPLLCKYLLFVITILAILLVDGKVFAQGRIPGQEKVKIDVNDLTGLQVEQLSSSLTPFDLATSLVGGGVSIQNVTFSGAEISAGIFIGGENIIGFNSGVILTSGSVNNVVGPNVSDSISTDNGISGDYDLDGLSGFTTYDAAILEFDFTPDSEQISFRFVFASDEYNEYVNSSFNDAFGFFINGVNHAIIEGSVISINTINVNVHPNLYINNDLNDGGGAIDTEMDGLTTVITCSSPVNPGQLNHIKLAIADASDHNWDSAVFIEGSSITTEKRPIILVPGMSASWSWCLLTNGTICDGDWSFAPTAREHYDTLIERLAPLYTEENGYLNIFYYDWRLSIDSHIPDLNAKIQEVKSLTGSTQVDIIGHSMGGLVARSYIQSDSYNNDVAHLITLGSPHEGSVKSYPMWQAYDFYEMDLLTQSTIALLMKVWQAQLLNMPELFVLRLNVPSIQQLLPTFEYMYDNNTGLLIPESTLTHRNSFLHSLNSNQSLLFDRCEVATINGYGYWTTDKFFVFEPTPINLITRGHNLWDYNDGIPNFSLPIEDYKSIEGDGTVLLNSADLLFPANNISIGNLEHGEIPDNPDAILAIQTFLGLTPESEIINDNVPKVLMLFANGSVDLEITDPLGRRLGKPTISQLNLHSNLEVETSLDVVIPGAEYYYSEGESYLIISIPEPVSGEYSIKALGNGDGEYELSLLDTFNDPVDLVTDPTSELWDTVTTVTKYDSETPFTFTYSDDGIQVINLIAEKPVIETPLMMGNSEIVGRTEPANFVEIFDEATDLLIGDGIADANGYFVINATSPLYYGQSVYPISNGIEGLPVQVGAHVKFLPLIGR